MNASSVLSSNLGVLRGLGKELCLALCWKEGVKTLERSVVLVGAAIELRDCRVASFSLLLETGDDMVAWRCRSTVVVIEILKSTTTSFE